MTRVNSLSANSLLGLPLIPGTRQRERLGAVAYRRIEAHARGLKESKFRVTPVNAGVIPFWHNMGGASNPAKSGRYAMAM